MLALRTPEGRTVAAQTKSWPLSSAQGIQQRAYWRPQSTLQLLGGGLANFDQLYWTQPMVQAVVNKLARSIARLPLKTYQYDGNMKPQERPRSAPANVFRQPYPRAGSFQWKEFLIGSLCVWGNATFVKFRGGRGQTPIELWPMPFQRVTVIEGRDQPIVAYQYMGNNTSGSLTQKPITFLPEDVVHFSWFNPDGHPWGRSPLESLATTLALENAGQRYALSSFANAARPASFIISENKLTTEQRNQLRAEIDAAYGGPDNAFKVALLDNGLDWKPIGGTMKDSSLVDLRKVSQVEVCAVYDIPPPLIGILDNATYSNISEQHVMLYMTTIAPILSMIEDILDAQFLDEAAWSDYVVKFDMGEVVRGDYDKRTQGIQREFMSGSLTPNEAREIQGRSPYGDPNDEENPANWIYVPVNTAPVSEKDGIMQPVKRPNDSNPNPRDQSLTTEVQEDPAAQRKPAAAAATTTATKPAAKKPAAKKPAAAASKATKPRRTSQAKKIEDILAVNPAHRG